jgi:drug/metabolite transporter (DMT)-like permease
VTAERHPTKIFWSFAAIYVVWGSTYLGIQIGIETIPPFTLAATRFLVAGAILFLLARWQGERVPGLAVWRTAALLGSLFFVFGNGLVVWAEQHVPSGRTALLASTSPIWTVLIESGLNGWRRPATRVLVGIGFGMVGLVLLASPNVGESSGAVSLLGVAGLVLASLAWASGSVYAHRHHLAAGPAMATSMKMLGGGAQLAVVALVTGEGHRASLDQVSRSSWLALGYLIIFGSVIGFTAFTYLLRVTTPEIVGTSSYVNPLVAVLLGWALAGEAVTAKMMIGAAVSLTGVVLIRWPVRVEPPPPEVEVGTLETGEFEVPTTDRR